MCGIIKYDITSGISVQGSFQAANKRVLGNTRCHKKIHAWGDFWAIFLWSSARHAVVMLGCILEGRLLFKNLSVYELM